MLILQISLSGFATNECAEDYAIYISEKYESPILI